MKKILVFTLAYFPFVGGAEVALREVMNRLKNKYDFQVVTARMKMLPSTEIIDGIPVHRMGFGIGWLDKLLFLPCLILYGLFHKADVVFGLLENQAALAARVVARMQGAKCVINLQSGDTEEWIKEKLGIFYFLYNWVYGKKPQYVVLSRYLKDRAIQHGVPADHIKIIPNGVDTKLFTRKGVDVKKVRRELGVGKKKVIITVSRLTLKNAVDDLIRAFALLRKDVPSILVICGTGEDEEKLKELARGLGVIDDIRFMGLIQHKELPKYLSSADVFVRPSLSEGFGNSFVEALACGVPIIGTPVGGIPDFLVDRKTGLFCKARNPEDLADKIKLLLRNKKLASAIAKNGRKMVKERYEWDIIATQFDEVLK
ncbi:MAG: glycosyltransferase family 4 protein [Candidatus Woesearchaeota archaeon]